MKHTVYNQCKAMLEADANELWLNNSNDKPLIRTALNDSLDSLLRGTLQYELLREGISGSMYNLYCRWLTDYVIKRHNK